jgi:hypothetical protein
VTSRPSCPTCAALVYTVQTVVGDLAVAYPCSCWLHPDTAEDLWLLYPDTDPEGSPAR